MYAQNVEWTEVRFDKTGGHPRKMNTVYLMKTNKGAPSPNQFKVSPDLVEKLGWGNGTRVNLYKAGGIFKMVEASTGLITFKKVGQTLVYTSWALCAELHPDVYGTEFDAWIDKKELYFRPKEVE